MQTVTTPQDLRTVLASWRQSGDRIGFVPTMGALHDGHLELVRQSQRRATRTVVSIFVNPLQFAPHEDLNTYPRDLQKDQGELAALGVDVVYAPSVETMYGEGITTSIDPGPLATILEGAIRPGHFAGVATVVTKLLMQVMPDFACFGEKDYQQLQIVRQTVRDLSVPVTIVPVPIVRDVDGLALSSRNVYLTPDERQRAVALPQTLKQIAAQLQAGDLVEAALTHGQAQLSKAGFQVDYLTLVDDIHLTPLKAIQPNARLLAAARMGRTRLIDNLFSDA